MSMISITSFFQELRQSIIVRSGIFRSEPCVCPTTEKLVNSNHVTNSNIENTSPRTIGTHASSATKKQKTIEDWDYAVLQLASAWH
jgi:hypothetical protein